MAGSVGDEGCDVNLTPLLDLVLQLIMFFMITVNFVQADLDEEIKLPSSTSAMVIDTTAEKFIFLNLAPGPDGKGELRGNLSGLTLNTPGKLRKYLADRKDEYDGVAVKKGLAPPKVVVVLRADQNVRYDKVWEVLESCKTAGFAHWQLRAMTKAAG